MSFESTLSETYSHNTICILSPVRIKQATFFRLGELQNRTFRIVHGDVPEDKEHHDFEATTYVAQLSLHLTHCDEVIRLPLIALEEDVYPEFSYSLAVDLRAESALMAMIMPSFSIDSVYRSVSVQCDINIYELIATAVSEPVFHPVEKTDGTAGNALDMHKWSITSLLKSAGEQIHKEEEEDSEVESVETPSQAASQLTSVLQSPFNPGKKLVRKLSKSMRHLTGRQQSAHKRTQSNPQVIVDTLGITGGSWESGPSSSYTSTFSIDLGS